MTPEQFSALAALMGQPDSKSAAAARLVLVEGLSSAEAARRVGITTQGANQAVQRCRRVIELAKVVGEGGGAVKVDGGSCGLHHSANKHDSCCRSLQWNNTVSAALEAGSAVVEVQPSGHPISHSVKYGFSRFVDGWGKPWPSGEDVGPGGVGWAWCEEWATKLAS